MIGDLVTGYGFWNPLIWLAVITSAFIISWLIYRLGEKDYDEGTEQTKPYLSGNAESSKSEVQIRGGNLYYGFTHSLKGYYDKLIPLHSGILNDYISWFLIGIIVIFVVVIII
ncbi:MAG TPA: hydrogenase [Methanocorpusculum sp.]|nr:hydrogenase [Methanocorpusculum sp.]